MDTALHSCLGYARSGEAYALGAALIWALAILLFRISGRSVPPLGLNLVKSLLAVPLCLAAMIILGENLLPTFAWSHYALMLLSGVLGIGISDTLVFASLNRLGAGLSAIVNCSYSLFVIGLSTVFLGERMTVMQLLGVLLIISAVLTVTQVRRERRLTRVDLAAGILLGLAAMLFMAVGIVLMKPLLAGSSILWTVSIRILGGLLFLVPVIAFHPDRRRIILACSAKRNRQVMIAGSLLGGFLSFLLWTGGMKYTQASEAAALNQTSTIFIFMLGLIFLREKATTLRIAALFMAVAGAVLVTLF